MYCIALGSWCEFKFEENLYAIILKADKVINTEANAKNFS